MNQEIEALQIESFCDYLQDLDRNYRRLSGLLQEKLTAISTFNLLKLDDIMKEEQAYVLLSKGFDASLQLYREKLGGQGDVLSELIDGLPEEYHTKLRYHHFTLKATLDDVKALNEKCQSLIESRLHTIDRSIKAYDKSENATYQKDGDAKSSQSPGAGLFIKSV